MIIVFGSLFMELLVDVNDLPKPGQNIKSSRLRYFPGGKAGNQAFAVGRMGEKVAVVGMTGDDDFAIEITDNLKKNGVMTSGVARTSLPTGTAITMKSKDGTRQYITYPGANEMASHEQVPDEILINGNYVLVQMSDSSENTLKLLERAKSKGCKTVLNMSPVVGLSSELLKNIDLLILNSREAEKIAESLKISGDDKDLKLARALSKGGKMSVVVTSGEDGSVGVNEKGKIWKVPAYRMPDDEISESISAGDCYCGTLVACLHRGDILPEAMRYASVAASLSIRAEGAQSSFPFIDEVDEHLSEIGEAKAVSS